MKLSQDTQNLVFTDLDGSLLDHHTYSYSDALPQVNRLTRLGIPLIPATSKTRAEIEHLRSELDNRHPFIVENGAAVFIPVGYFQSQPPGTVERGPYWVRELSASREQWLALLASLSDQFPDCFEHFHRAGVDGIMRMTNLPRERAVEANQREYSEPVKWLGSPVRKGEFVKALQGRGASVLQGGRFLAVSGDCDKGRALVWLRETYRQLGPANRVHDLAIGDSDNDVAMLEAADAALVVRSTVHDYPSLRRQSAVLYSSSYGPAGWAEGVARWLEALRLDNNQV